MTDVPDSPDAPTADQPTSDGSDRWVVGLGIAFVVVLLLDFVKIHSLTGLPAHPLLLHIPVVLIPCLVIAAIAFVVRPNWRKQYGPAYGVGALVTLAGTILTVEAGYAYRDDRFRSLGQTVRALGSAGNGAQFGGGALPTLRGAGGGEQSALNHHATLGGELRIAMIVFVVLILFQIAVDRGTTPSIATHFGEAKAPLAVALSSLVGLLAIISGVLVFATGHAGAKLVFGNDAGRGGGATTQRFFRFPGATGATGGGGRQFTPPQGFQGGQGQGNGYPTAPPGQVQ